MTSLNGKDHTFHGRPEKECSAKPKIVSLVTTSYKLTRRLPNSDDMIQWTC